MWRREDGEAGRLAGREYEPASFGFGQPPGQSETDAGALGIV
jgi:hypothetical protein